MRWSVLAVVLLVGCSKPDGAGDDVTGDDHTDDPDGPGGVDDTDPVDTLVPDDTDFVRLDSADTFQYADSDAQVDTGAGGGGGGVTSATPQNLHDGVYTPGQTLSFAPMVVTATRLVTRPPATNGFAVQLPTGNAAGSGFYVDLKEGSPVPAVGDLVAIVGRYEEWPQHASVPRETMSRIVVHSTAPGSSWTKVGTSALPPPAVLSLSDVADGIVAEDYEGMLVRVDEGVKLSVLKNPSLTYQEFTLGIAGGDAVTVDPWFFDYTQTLNPKIGGNVTALIGVLWYEPTDHKVLPRSAADFVNWKATP